MKAALDPRRLVRHLRLVLVLVVIGGLGYLSWRYERVTLPDEGCSPLLAFPPGTRVLTDKRWRRLGEGDVVLFHIGPEQLRLGRVEEVVSGPPTRYVVLGDDPDCPGPDSRELGPVSGEDVAARVILTLPW